jgi:hypothetical protein
MIGERRERALVQGGAQHLIHAAVQSEKPPVHPLKADFGRAFQEDAATAVHRAAAMDGRGENSPLYAGRTVHGGRAAI